MTQEKLSITLARFDQAKEETENWYDLNPVEKMKKLLASQPEEIRKQIMDAVLQEESS